jgi:hypothetical protein
MAGDSLRQMTRLSIEIAVGISCGLEETLTKETPITRSSLCSHGEKILVESLIYVFQSILTHVLGLTREDLHYFSVLTACTLHEVPY